MKFLLVIQIIFNKREALQKDQHLPMSDSEAEYALSYLKQLKIVKSEESSAASASSAVDSSKVFTAGAASGVEFIASNDSSDSSDSSGEASVAPKVSVGARENLRSIPSRGGSGGRNKVGKARAIKTAKLDASQTSFEDSDEGSLASETTPIVVDEKGHLISIDSSKDSVTVRRIFQISFSWGGIPPFAILTGINGSGKTVILNMMKAILEKSMKVSFIGASEVEEFNTHSSIPNKIEEICKREENKEEFIRDILFYIKDIKNNYKDSKYIKMFGGFPKNYQAIVETVGNHLIKNYHDIKSLSDDKIKRSIQEEIIKPHFVSEGNIINYGILTILHSAIEENDKYRTKLKEFYSKKVVDLYNFWKEQTGESDFEKFLIILENDEKKTKLVVDFINENFKVDPPLDRLNSLLPNSFPYTLVYIDSLIKCRPRGILASDKLIELAGLSSGHQDLLKFVTIVFYNQGFASNLDSSLRVITNQPQIILLDEPDKHLDPRSCKLFFDFIYQNLVKQEGIQVIMTTHRLDTIALVPEPEPSRPKVGIFTINKSDKSFVIEPTHKVLALSRLSRNLQEVTGFQIKVYTEAFDDRNFYEGIYANLMKYREELRKKDNGWWRMQLANQDNAVKLSQLADLSKRYQMSFHSVCDKKRENGGYTMVEKFVERERADIEEARGGDEIIKMGNLFRKYGIDKPFGIIDLDDRVIHAKSDGEVLILSGQDTGLRIVKRHSLENFVCDPIMMCALDLKDLKVKPEMVPVFKTMQEVCGKKLGYKEL